MMSMWCNAVRLIIGRSRRLSALMAGSEFASWPARAVGSASTDSAAGRTGPLLHYALLTLSSGHSCAMAMLHVECNGLPAPTNMVHARKNGSGLLAAPFRMKLIRTCVTPVEIRLGETLASNKPGNDLRVPFGRRDERP